MNKKVIAGILTLMLIFVSEVRAEVTVREVLSRLQSNSNSIKDQKMDMTMTMQIPNAKEMTRKQKCVYKGGKMKVEDITDGANKGEMVIDGNIMKMKDSKGNVTTRQIPMMPSNVNYRSGDISQYTKDYNITMDTEKSDEANGLYMLELTPKAKTALSFKMKMLVDYNKGIIKKTETYTKDDKLFSVMENKEFENKGNVWVIRKTENTIYSGMGEITTEMVYNNITINGGVSDEESEME